MNTCKGCAFNEREGVCTYGGMCFDKDGNRTKYMAHEHDSERYWKHLEIEELIRRALRMQQRSRSR